MIPASLHTAQIADVETLRGVPESRILEYKQELNLNTDEEKKEFLADVSSFANTSGGDILYGLEKEVVDNQATGCFSNIFGIPTAQVDALKQQVENLLGSCIKPRFPFYEIHSIPLAAGERSVLVLRMHKSLLAPHRVDFKGSKRFWGRNSAGKYELEVEELRAAFTLRASLEDKVHEHWGRFTMSLASNPFLAHKPFVALQVTPSNAFQEETSLDLKRIRDENDTRIGPLYGIRSSNVKFNFEGLWRGRDDADFVGYVQVHHSGKIETVSTVFFESTEDGWTISMTALEHHVIEKLFKYVGFLQERLPNLLPLFVTLSLHHVMEAFVPDTDLPHGVRISFHTHPVERADLLFPTLTLEKIPNSEEEVATLLRPIFDRLWSAIGVPTSPNFTEDGKRQVGER